MSARTILISAAVISLVLGHVPARAQDDADRRPARIEVETYRLLAEQQLQMAQIHAALAEIQKTQVEMLKTLAKLEAKP